MPYGVEAGMILYDPDPTDQNDHAWNEDDVRTLRLKNLSNVDG